MATKKKEKVKKSNSAKGKHAKAKGARGEREWRDMLRKYGLTAIRSQQFCGLGKHAADVLCDELPEVHFEVKRTEQCKPYAFVEQATLDAKGNLPVVAFKMNNKDWLVIMDADEFLTLLTSTPFLQITDQESEPSVEDLESDH